MMAHGWLKTGPKLDALTRIPIGDIKVRVAASEVPFQVSEKITVLDIWQQMCSQKECSALADGYALYFGNNHIVNRTALMMRGFLPTQIKAEVNGWVSEFFDPIGAGVGGSSVFYAATLERPERHDLDDSTERPHPTGGWPVGYDDFEHYYDLAEK